MALGRTYSVALVGLNGYMVEVEADIGQTLPAFVILGLPDASLNEARERIRSAAKNSGIPLSRRKITANLIPASLPKRGSGFDLAVAALVPGANVRGYRTLARLALDFGADPQELALDFDPEDIEDCGDVPAAASCPDMADVSGQGDARRALEVAAAGA